LGFASALGAEQLERAGRIAGSGEAAAAGIVDSGFVQSSIVESSIVESIDEARLTTLKGNTHPLAIARFDRGRVSPDLQLGDLFLVLRRSEARQKAFDRFVASEYDENSPNYHLWLTPQQAFERYGPAPSDIQVVENWLLGHGLSVDGVAADGMSIRFSGAASLVEAAFHTEIHNLDVKGERHVGNMSDPLIPEALAPVVAGVKALHNFFPRPLHRLGGLATRDLGGWRRVPDGGGAGGASGRPRPDFTSVDPYGDVIEDVAPYDFAKIYNVLPEWTAAKAIDGTGETIAIAGTSNIHLADVAAFRSAFGLPAKAPTVVVTNNDPGACPGFAASCADDLIENTLEVEWAGAEAKGATITLVTSSAPTATSDPLYLSEDYVVEHKTAAILNVSYGSCELALGTAGNTEYNNLWETAAAEGMAVFVASGDAGSPGCDQGFDAIDGVPYAAQFGLGVNGLASTAYDTAVGGTDLNWGATAAPYWSSTNGTGLSSALGYVPEVPWNSTCVNPLVLPALASDAAYLGVSGVVDAESACNFVIESGPYILANFGVDLAGLVDTIGGGGGASNCTASAGGNPESCSGKYGKPSWQTGAAGIPSDGARDVPDVSFFASNGFLGSAYLICVSEAGSACVYSAGSEPTAQEVGGTSVASPAMAGVMALINQRSGSAQGNPNTALYELAARQSYSKCSAESVKASATNCVFNDIDTGTNAMACVSPANAASLNCAVKYAGDPAGILTGFSAGTGYDQATGLGSLNVANAVNNWPSIAPYATFSTTKLTFAATAEGFASASQAVTLKNTGKAPLSLSGTGLGISISGTNASSFSQTNTCGTSVAAGASCAVTVVFKPTATGSLTAELSFADNAFGSPQLVALSGTGTTPAPAATLSAQSLSFGSTAVGSSNTAPAITLTNSGTAALTISSIGFTGPNASVFSETNTCGSSLGAGKNCGITITFKPTVVGTLTATLDVKDNAAGSPQTVALSGVATTPAPVASLSAQSLSFGSTKVGSSNTAPAISLTNSGTAALTISSIGFTGTNATAFSETNTCGSSLGAGKSCGITITFKPTVVGTLTATLDVKDNAAGSPQTVSLSGVAVSAGTAPPVHKVSNEGIGKGAGRVSDGGAANGPQIAREYGRLPLRFEANQGQTDERVKFLSRGKGFSLFLTGQEAVLSLARPGRRSTARDVVRMGLSGANAQAAPEGLERLPGVANYMVGNDRSRWRTNIPNYGRVRYGQVYPGVDIDYYGNGQQLEYDFQVAAGADPGAIRLRFEGARKLRLDAEGNLRIAASNGEIAFHQPAVYQIVEGRRSTVPGRFKLLAGNSVGFSLGAYDRSKPLTIDPTLVYSTYLGGSDSDTISAIAVDSSGNAYLTGSTASTNFPVTPKAFQTTDKDADSTVFVTKLNSSGSALIYSTFLGGTGGPSGGDIGRAIAVDSSGDAFVGGYTYSNNFPTTAGAFQTTNQAFAQSGSTGFVTKLNPTGTGLLYSTYLGGSVTDDIFSLAIDSSGDAYVAGAALSSNFPVTSGVVQTTNRSAADGGFNEFVTKLNPAGTGLIYSTYLGGSGEYVFPSNIRVAIDSSGDAYVAGIAISTDFPVTSGAYQKTNKASSGRSDLTLSELNPTATKLVYSTYLGGSGSSYGDDAPNGLAVDSAGNAYLTGITWEANYPVTKGAFQTTSNAVANDLPACFLTKMNPTGSALVYSTYLGGSGGDRAFAVALDSADDAYLTGSAGSTDFPVTGNAYQTTNPAAFNDGSVVFLTELNPSGSGLVYSTYFGGQDSFEDTGYGIALGAHGEVYFAGITGASDFPITKGAYETVFNSQNFTTGFVSEFTFSTAPTTAPSVTLLTSSQNPATAGTAVIFTASVTPATGSMVPTGNVIFNIDEKNVATLALNGVGYASYSTTSLGNGQHSILASYQGSSIYSASGQNIIENITAATPAIAPAGGVYTAAQVVTLTDATTGATIYYTTDGSDPGTSTTAVKYTGPFVASEQETVQAVAKLSGAPNSITAAASYSFLNAPTALAAPATAIATPNATLNALVNTNGMSGSYHFVYGTSATAMTSSTPATPLVESPVGSRINFAPVAVSAKVSSLVGKTKYYYQVVVTTPAGVSTGSVVSFTTN